MVGAHAYTSLCRSALPSTLSKRLVDGAATTWLHSLLALQLVNCWCIVAQVLLAPAGIVACFKPLTDASLFLLLYGLAAVYFSGVMVRPSSGASPPAAAGAATAALVAALFEFGKGAQGVAALWSACDGGH